MGLHLKKFETEQEYDDFTASDSYVKHNVSVIWPSRNVHYDVRGSHVTGVTLNKTTTEINKGLTETLIASVRPNTAEDKSIAWSTSDSAVATVNNGVITAVGCGNATITVTTTDGGYTAQCATSVINPLTNISLNKNLIGISTGDTYQLEVEYSPSDTCDSKNVSWATSNRNVATVNNGVVSGVSFGSATITATVGSYTATCAVEIFPVSDDYLTFVATEDGTFKFSGNSIDYSLDDGATWTSLASDTNSPTITNGNSVLWKATLTPTSSNGIGTFSSTGNFMVAGNPMSLLYGDDFADKGNLSEKGYAFNKLFSGCTKLTSAVGLKLPALTLGEGCYKNMFNSCSSLTSIPELPATTMTNSCYYGMFSGCTSLTTVLSNYLPSTTLAESCYSMMFADCSGLTTTPSLPATNLNGATHCYSFMFADCTSLTTAPSLPATTLAEGCYVFMFEDCTGLTTAPSLPATTLKESCYRGMFGNCTSLTTAPSLPATTLVDDCYSGMFNGCRSLTATPTLSFTRFNVGTWDGGVCDSMFKNCTSLTTAPALPATTLTKGCYEYMFEGCTGLVNVPSNMLSATSINRYCYKGMFKGCTSLTTAPDLPAATLRDFCYEHMFSGCTSLNSITCLATTRIEYSNSVNWVAGVSPTGTFTKKAGVTTWPSGDNGIPNGWTVVDAS